MDRKFFLIDEAIDEYIWDLITQCVEKSDHYIDARCLAYGDHPDFFTTDNTVVKSQTMWKSYTLNEYITVGDFITFIEEEIKKYNANVLVFEEAILGHKGLLILHMRIGRVDNLLEFH